ncbi:MAG: hypothetical protein AB7K24_14985, partial [Gemmataceae bacterium]
GVARSSPGSSTFHPWHRGNHMASESLPIDLKDANREITIYSHSAIFYWWPVWAVGLVMFVITMLDGGRLAIATGSKIHVATIKDGKEYYADDEAGNPVKLDGNKVLMADKEISYSGLHIARNKNLGVVFVILLIIIILVTNIPLRGLWSLIVILFVVLLTVILALAGVWGQMLEYVGLLQIYINAGGYLFISLVLFIVWAVTVFFFDHRTYVVVQPRQIKTCQAVGAGEKVYDTTGMTFHKRQDDLFRHWIIGLGSGDLIIQKSQTHEEIDMPNVLFIGSKIKQIEKLIREIDIV